MKRSIIQKVCAFSLAAVMISGCAAGAVSVSAANTSSLSVSMSSEKVSGSYRYTVGSDGSATITAYNGSESDITLPSVLDGKPVTAVGEAAFKYNYNLSSLIVPKGIRKVGYNSFAYCINLKKLTLPDGLTEIGTAAFNGCKSLTYVDLPKTLITMNSYAFAGCRSLKSVVVPQKVTVLNFSVFESCSSLRYVSVSERLTKVYSNAFGHCSSLTSVRLPKTITNIYGLAFCDCPELSNLTIFSTNAQIDKVAFDACPKLTIYGVKGSTAEARAKENGIPFSTQKAPAQSLTTITPSNIDAGSTVTVKTKGIDGTAPYQFAVYYRKSDASVWNKAQEFSANSTVTFVPKYQGTYIVKVRVRDSSSRITEKDYTIKVNQPLTNTSAISKTSLKLGDSVKVTCNASGGQGGYQYSASYQLSGASKWTKLLNYGKGSSVEFTPKKSGTYNIKTFVRDTAGKIVSKTFSITVM